MRRASSFCPLLVRRRNCRQPFIRNSHEIPDWKSLQRTENCWAARDGGPTDETTMLLAQSTRSHQVHDRPPVARQRKLSRIHSIAIFSGFMLTLERVTRLITLSPNALPRSTPTKYSPTIGETDRPGSRRIFSRFLRTDAKPAFSTDSFSSFRPRPQRNRKWGARCPDARDRISRRQGGQEG